MIDCFFLYLPAFYDELGTDIETVWITNFPYDDRRLKGSSYVIIFLDPRAQWSMLRYID